MERGLEMQMNAGPGMLAAESPGTAPLGLEGRCPIFHITHWKAGSEWVRAVMNGLAGERFVARKQMHAHLYEEPIRADGVYSPLYLHRHAFFRVATMPHRRFIVIRDLRDTLVSWYFSARYSHPTDGNPTLSGVRAQLEPLDQENGILYMLENRLAGAAKIQSTWIKPSPEGGREFIVRYEDLWADQQGAFARICRHIGLGLEDAERERIVMQFSFESRSGGRKPGEEDVSSHFRKGLPGDWRTHFTPRIAERFKALYGEVLMASGYEETMGW
jgi:hypothetical protein